MDTTAQTNQTLGNHTKTRNIESNIGGGFEVTIDYKTETRS